MKKILVCLLASGLLSPLCVFAQNLDWKTADTYKKKDLKNQLSARLSEYVKQNTAVSSAQVKFGKNLAKELRKYGAENIKTDKNGTVTAEIPANVKGNLPTVTFIALTASQAQHANPQTHENYSGGEIVLSASPRVTLDVYNAPQLTRAYGHDLLTADGNAPIGTDTKAGVAVLMQAVQYLDEHPSVSHGKVQLIFLPNTTVNLPFSPETLYTYTLEQGGLGEMITENFSGKNFQITFEGNRQLPLGETAHSAFADNVLVASDFHTLLPRASRPETTSGTRGFIYVDSIVHDGNKTQITGLIRAFSDDDLNRLSAEVTRAFNTVKSLHNKVHHFTLEFQNTSHNRKDQIAPQALTMAEKALRAEDIFVKKTVSRNETLSSALAEKGYFFPALFTGTYNANTPREYADLDETESSFRTVMRIISQAAIPLKN